MATTPEPFICGNQLGDWVEAALQFYLYTTWVYSIIYMVGYFMNVKIFGAGRIFSSACPKGFSVQNTWAAGYSGDTSCISDVAWSIEKGPRLTYLLMSGCVAALAIVLVSRARDAGLAFRWPSSRRLGARSPPPADQDNKPQHMFLSTNDNNAFQVYQYMLFAFLQIIGLLWRVLTAPTLHDPYPSCPKGLWTHDFSAKKHQLLQSLLSCLLGQLRSRPVSARYSACMASGNATEAGQLQTVGMESSAASAARCAAGYLARPSLICVAFTKPKIGIPSPPIANSRECELFVVS